MHFTLYGGDSEEPQNSSLPMCSRKGCFKAKQWLGYVTGEPLKPTPDWPKRLVALIGCRSGGDGWDEVSMERTGWGTVGSGHW